MSSLGSAKLGKGKGEGETALTGAWPSMSTLVPKATGVGELAEARSEPTGLAPTTGQVLAACSLQLRRWPPSPALVAKAPAGSAVRIWLGWLGALGFGSGLGLGRFRARAWVRVICRGCWPHVHSRKGSCPCRRA